MTSQTLKRMGLASAGIAAAVLAVLVGANIWLSHLLRHAGPDVRASVKQVVMRCLARDLTGTYWENEMIRQYKSVAGLELRARLDFQRELLLHCDLDTSRALVFADIVGRDAAALQADLTELKRGPRFETLSPDQRQAVDDWILELPVVARSRPVEQ